MARGRPGGNPDIADYGFKSDRKHPLTKTVNFRVDEPTKEALKNGLLPGWTKIARQAIELALAEITAAKEQTEQDLENLSLIQIGFLDGLSKKDPARSYILEDEYMNGYSRGLFEYYKRLYGSTNKSNIQSK